MIEEKVSKNEGGQPAQSRADEGWGARSEEEILTQAANALREIAAEIEKTSGSDEVTAAQFKAQAQRYICALNGLNTTLRNFGGQVSAFSKETIIYKVLDEGWLEILMYTLQAPVTNELYLTAITTFSTLLVAGNICGRYTELPGFAKLIIVCISGLSQVPAVFRRFDKSEFDLYISPHDQPPDEGDDEQCLPLRIESCIRLLSVVGWILEDHESDSLRDRWRSHMIQCGLVSYCIEIVLSCDAVLLLDCVTRSLSTVFQFRPAHDVILQTPMLIDHLMAKICELYALEPSMQDCGGTAYILMAIMHTDQICREYIDRDASNGWACTHCLIEVMRTCDSTRLSLSSVSKILSLIGAHDDAAKWMLSHGILEVMANAAKRFHELKYIPAQNAIFVLHEVIRDTTITDENTEVITKDFLEKLSKAVAGNLVLLEFMTSLHRRGFSDSQPGRIETKKIKAAQLADDPLFWLLVSLSRSSVVISRIAELFPTKDVPMAVYIIATFCATTQSSHPDGLEPLSLEGAWAARKEQWRSDKLTTMDGVTAKQLLGQCDHCAVYPRQQGTLKICSRCRMAKYCSQECQRAAWKQHKKLCHPCNLNTEPKEAAQS